MHVNLHQHSHLRLLWRSGLQIWRDIGENPPVGEGVSKWDTAVDFMPIRLNELHLTYPVSGVRSKPITLELRQGKLYGMCGPSGSGKAALLQHLGQVTERVFSFFAADICVVRYRGLTQCTSEIFIMPWIE